MPSRLQNCRFDFDRHGILLAVDSNALNATCARLEIGRWCDLRNQDNLARLRPKAAPRSFFASNSMQLSNNLADPTGSAGLRPGDAGGAKNTRPPYIQAVLGVFDEDRPEKNRRAGPTPRRAGRYHLALSSEFPGFILPRQSGCPVRSSAFRRVVHFLYS